jgi:hypothetical protein
MPHGRFHNNKNEFREELIAYFPVKPHGLHRKRRVQQYFCCCECIRRCCNVFTEPLPSNDTDTQTGGRDLWSTALRWARCHDVYTKFNKNCLSYSKVDGARDTQNGDRISLYLFFQNKEIRLIMSTSSVGITRIHYRSPWAVINKYDKLPEECGNSAWYEKRRRFNV